MREFTCLLLTCVGSAIGFSCGNARPLPDMGKVGIYQSELILCVEKAKTKEESKSCREEVMTRYGRMDASSDALPSLEKDAEYNVGDK